MRRPSALLYATTVLLLTRPSSADSTVLYLRFNGATITKTTTDNSDAAESSICAASVPAAALSRFGSGESVRDAIVAQVDNYFADFDLLVTATRPHDGPYHMIVVGGLPALCGQGDGIGGLSTLDCENASAINVGFVFAAGLTAAYGIGLAAAHEMGHMLGLPHTLDDCDLMSNFYCAEGDKAFADKEVEVAPDHSGHCGLTRIDPRRMLLEVLGQRPPAKPDAGPDLTDAGVDDVGVDGDAGTAEAGGCIVARWDMSNGFSTPFWLLFLLVLRKKRRTKDGDSR